jgi:hypothetical protein
MADKKISALTGASTPLAGTEVLPIVQSGSTVKVSVANLTAGRSISAAGVSSSTTILMTGAENDQLQWINGVHNWRANVSSGGNWYLYNQSNNTFPFTIESNTPSGTLAVTATGRVGIGGAPSFQLQLSTDSAAKPSTNTWTIASDARIKNVTGEYTKGLDAVCALRPVTYEYNGIAGFAADGKENISIIAQEAKDHFPECVGTFETKLNEDEDDKETITLYNWNGHALTFALVNAVKELKSHIDALETRLAATEAN